MYDHFLSFEQFVIKDMLFDLEASFNITTNTHQFLEGKEDVIELTSLHFWNNVLGAEMLKWSHGMARLNVLFQNSSQIYRLISRLEKGFIRLLVWANI